MAGIVYLLGAGASFQSMPLVENFGNRFSFFEHYIKNRIREEIAIPFLKLSHAFREEVQSHASFDTLFKKYFHQKNVTKIVDYKKVLLAFFAFEHLVDRETWIELTEIHDPVIAGSIINNKIVKYNLDPRYDALVAGLLKPIEGTSEFHCPVTFITWNYDLNLLRALANFVNPEFKFQDLHTLNYSGNPNHFRIGQTNVFHLNGLTYHPQMSDLTQFSSTDVSSRMEGILRNLHDETGDALNHINKISFAWEGNADQSMQLINKIIQNAAQLVVIGYSFPIYNRLIDQSFFNNRNLEHKVVHIQDPHADGITDLLIDLIQVNRSFISTTPGSVGKFNFYPHVNCRNFFVPNNLFSK